MLTIAKLLGAATIALAILNPSLEGKRLPVVGLPRADTCECKAKANDLTHSIVPRADSCSCKASALTP
jgi:hypothetical protein